MFYLDSVSASTRRNNNLELEQVSAIWLHTLTERLGFKTAKTEGRTNSEVPIILSIGYFFKAKVYPSAFQRAINEHFWSLFVGKFSFDQKLRRKSGSDLEKAKIEGLTVTGILNIFPIDFFKWKVYLSGFKWAISNEPFPTNIF